MPEDAVAYRNPMNCSGVIKLSHSQHFKLIYLILWQKKYQGCTALAGLYGVLVKIQVPYNQLGNPRIFSLTGNLQHKCFRHILFSRAIFSLKTVFTMGTLQQIQNVFKKNSHHGSSYDPVSLRDSALADLCVALNSRIWKSCNSQIGG